MREDNREAQRTAGPLVSAPADDAPVRLTGAAALSEAKQALLERRLRRAADPLSATAIPRRPARIPAPLSFAQERLWFMEQLAPGATVDRDPLLLKVGADFDETAFTAALGDVAARHEALRMRFPGHEGRPFAIVDPSAGVHLPVLQVADKAQVDAAVMAATARPFDLVAGPLLRTLLLRVADGTGHYVLIDMHRAVADEQASEILIADLAESYRARCAGDQPGLTPLHIGYGDFAYWQRRRMESPAARADLAYWQRQLAGVPVLELPTDAPRPARQTFGGGAHHFHLDTGLVADLAALGSDHGATMFVIVLAGFQALLARYSGQSAFAVGCPMAGRSHPHLDGVVGTFVNMTPLRAEFGDDPTIAELIARIRRTVLEALAHREVPFEKIIKELGVARDMSRPALFQATFALHNYGLDRPQVVGVRSGTWCWRPVELPACSHDLELHAYDPGDGTLQCRFVYSTALLSPATVGRMDRHLRMVLRGMAAHPESRVSELDFSDSAERELLAQWNATDCHVFPAATLPGVILAQVRRTPEAVAVVDENASLTYGQLDSAANRVAGRLRAAGAGPESVVAVCVERSVELIAALLGILKAGAAYLPLDPEYPAERLTFMLAESGARVLLTQRRLRGRVSACSAEVLLVDDAGTWPDLPETDPNVAIDPDTAAYMIYTSGSTGRPKGVVNTHRGIVNRLGWMQAEFTLGRGDVVLQKTPTGFDVSVWELFLPLLAGARLVLARPGGHRDPAYLRDAIDAHKVTIIHFVPSMLAAFLADGEAGGNPAREAARCATLRLVICSGEELSPITARRCLDAMPWVRLDNLYGPTEAAVDVTWWHCTPDRLLGCSRVPIGTPISNVRIYLLDRHLREVPIGAAGQLHIGGVQVARGYHHRPALTAERFIADPFGPPGARLYATGDLARRRRDGTVEFLGRIDDQVKLRGLRIELGEIEAALRDQPGVRDAAVAVKEVGQGDKRLVGYVVANFGRDTSALRDALAQRLPDFMVPTYFVALDELPLSQNGKLDRRSLPLPELSAAPGDARAEPRTELERAIAQIWRDVLGFGRFGIDDDFFDLGGHSLLATQVVARMRKITMEGIGRAGVTDLFQHPTVRGLADLLQQDRSGSRRLLRELTKPLASAERVCSYVCVPYGGGSAAVYQPVADALPVGHCLYSVAIPGHDVGLDEEALPFDELARCCVDEILEQVEGPLVLYGHCGMGGALITELAQRLQAAGRPLEAVYIGGVFPSARPNGVLGRVQSWAAHLRSDRLLANWLQSIGLELRGIDPEHADRIIGNVRRVSRDAEDYFTRLLDSSPPRLRVPIISVVGERDPITDFYQERYKEWRSLSDTVALAVLDEAGHNFVRHRAEDLVEIITSIHHDLPTAAAGAASAHAAARAASAHAAAGATGAPAPAQRQRWWIEGLATSGGAANDDAPVKPGMGRFLAVCSGQVVSLTGSALTAWAIPVWIYTKTGSLGWFGLSGIFAVIPMLITMPLAGAMADRNDRRRVIMIAACAASTVELMLAMLLWSGHPALAFVYPAMVLVIVAVTFQRVTFIAAIPQLAPKRYLGNANGVAQVVNSVGTLVAPPVAAALLAVMGLQGILLIDVASYLFAIGALSLVRFPNLLGRRRREAFWPEVLGGLHLTWDTRAFRAMLIFFGACNLIYAAPVLLVTPLVLGFGTLREVGQAGLAEGLGALAGGLAMALWGGPRRGRMVCIMITVGVGGVSVVVTGIHPELAIVLAGLFATAFSVALCNGIYMTIIQVKVAQRLHGRVIALTQAISWSTIPLGFALFVPASGPLLNPLMARHGALANTVGVVIGTGPGRGIGLAYVLFGFATAITALVGLSIRTLTRLDIDMPDSPPDDVIGLSALAERTPPEPRLDAGPVARMRRRDVYSP